MSVTFVCLDKDMVCGDRPQGWCSTCPLRGQQPVIGIGVLPPFGSIPKLGDRLQAEIESLRASLALAQKDAQRLDWLEGTDGGISIVNDDNGQFAASDMSMQACMDEGVPLPVMTVYITPEQWKPTAREAIDFAMAQEAIDAIEPPSSTLPPSWEQGANVDPSVG